MISPITLRLSSALVSPPASPDCDRRIPSPRFRGNRYRRPDGRRALQGTLPSRADVVGFAEHERDQIAASGLWGTWSSAAALSLSGGMQVLLRDPPPEAGAQRPAH